MNLSIVFRFTYIWLHAIRPKTLIASISPVVLGTLLVKEIQIPIFLMTLLFASLIQIGTNLCNDYFDFIKKTDNANRIGPLKVLQTGLISPLTMKKAYQVCFLFAFLSGSFLLSQGGILLLVVSIISILLGYLYTAGPYPLSYLGIADLFVILFFGPVACFGAYYLQTKQFHLFPILIGMGPGLISTAIICANNLRDYQTDKQANKKTLVVRFGLVFGEIEFISCILGAIFFPFLLYKYGIFPPTFRYSLLLLPSAFLLFFRISKKNSYIQLLPKTSLFLLLYTIVMGMFCYEICAI